MADAASIAIRHNLAIKEVAEILERHDPEVGQRIAKTNHGRSVPSPKKAPLETAAYHAECLASLARLVDEHLTPKKRGRPPKAS
jgi:S-adenosylmethionine hydrolase